MTLGEILVTVITGLVGNECCDVSPWVARKLVRWSAHRRYAPPSRAALRAEELAAYIDDRPGGLFKLITALSFATAAIVTRKTAAPGIVPSTSLWQPFAPAVSVEYLETDSGEDRSNIFEMHQSWRQLTNEVRNAGRELGVGSRSWRRCIKKLREITDDDRWTIVGKHVDRFKEIKSSRPKPRMVEMVATATGTTSVIYRFFFPTDSSVTQYQAAVDITRADIRRLADEFLLSSAPRGSQDTAS